MLSFDRLCSLLALGCSNTSFETTSSCSEGIAADRQSGTAATCAPAVLAAAAAAAGALVVVVPVDGVVAAADVLDAGRGGGFSSR